jgi:chromosome segregation ATPase
MTVLDNLAKQANRLASDVQTSLKRARVEGERRLLQRQHRAALEELGERAYELVRAGKLPEEPLAAEISAVESKLMEIEAKVTEVEELRTEEEAAAADDPSKDAFPMVAESPAETSTEPTPGPGWEAAERFFKHDS